MFVTIRDNFVVLTPSKKAVLSVALLSLRKTFRNKTFLLKRDWFSGIKSELLCILK